MAEEVRRLLPHNRRQVFFDVVRNHWGRLLGYGLVVLLFSLPWHAVTLWERLALMGVSQAQDRQEAYAQLVAGGNTFALLRIVCLPVVAVCIAGLLRCIRQYAWGEPVFFGADLWQGVRQNGVQTVLLALLAGVVYALTVYAWNAFLLMQDRTAATVLLFPVSLSIFAGLPVAAYSAAQLPVYSNRLGRTLLNALQLTARSYGKTLLALLCCMLPFALQALPNLIGCALGCIVSSLLVPFVLLGWFLFASRQLDEHINKRLYPELVDKGITK